MRHLRLIAASALCACLGCTGFGSSEDPATQPAGPHARGIFALAQDTDQPHLGHAAADDTSVYLIASRGNTPQTVTLWKVPREQGEASQLWSEPASEDLSGNEPRVAVSSSDVLWIQTSSASRRCVLHTLPKNAKTPVTRELAETGGQCAVVGLATHSDQAFVAVITDTGAEDCRYSFQIDGSAGSCLKPSRASVSILALGGQDAGDATLASSLPMVSRYLPDPLLVDAANLYWFEPRAPEGGTSPNNNSWEGGALVSMSKAAGALHDLTAIEPSLYPMGMGDSGAALVLALASVRPFSQPPVAGCTLRTIDKKTGAATTIASSPDRLCFAITGDGSSAWFLSGWGGTNEMFRQGVSKVPSATGTFPGVVVLDRDWLNATMVLSSGTDLVVMSETAAVAVPKSLVQ
jgi:hypothetical protein